MLSKKEIGLRMLEIASELIEFKKQNKYDKEVTMHLGILTGLMITLGKDEGLLADGNWLNYTNTVLKELLKSD